MTPASESRCRWADHHLSNSFPMLLGHHSSLHSFLQHTMALHAQARQLARHGRIRTRRARVAVSGSPHRRQANPRPRSQRMAGPPQQAPRQGRLAIQNRRRPRQAEETIPSVRVTRATRATFALKAGVWFRRARFFIFAPDSQAKHACRQAEIPLSALFKIPEPPQGVSRHIADRARKRALGGQCRIELAVPLSASARRRQIWSPQFRRRELPPPAP